MHIKMSRYKLGQKDIVSKEPYRKNWITDTFAVDVNKVAVSDKLSYVIMGKTGWIS